MKLELVDNGGSSDQKEARAERLRFRDWILENILVGVSKAHDVNKQMALRGGGALHFVYSSPRYSADVDFAVPEIERDYVALENMAKTMFFAVNNTPVIPEKRTSGPTNIRYAYCAHNKKEINGKIEMTKDVIGKTREADRFPGLVVETPDQIYADKIYATFCRMAERNSIKGTDLFDLEWISKNFENGKASEQLIEETVKKRNISVWTQQNFEAVMKYIDSPVHHVGFLRQFRKTMGSDFYEGQSFDSNYIKKCAQHFEELKKAFK